MAQNPYSSPMAYPDPVSDLPPQRQPVASQGKRFLNMIIDSIVLQGISMGVGFVFGLLYAANLISRNGAMTQADEDMLSFVGFGIGLFASLVYFVVTEAVFQRSLAKFVTGTKVVNEDGGRPTFGQILGRSFARFIPFEAFSFLGGSNPVGWHDSLSKTRVVDSR